jgi:hypothetical protein
MKPKAARKMLGSSPAPPSVGTLTATQPSTNTPKALDNSGVQDFVPYVLRHTALTRLGEKAGGNVFALASIAGHSSITVTQRYVHPQADTINRIFTSKLLVGTKLGTTKELPKAWKQKIPRRGTAQPIDYKAG